MTRKIITLNKFVKLLTEMVILTLMFIGVLIVITIVSAIAGSVGWKIPALTLLIVVYVIMDCV